MSQLQVAIACQVAVISKLRSVGASNDEVLASESILDLLNGMKVSLLLHLIR